MNRTLPPLIATLIIAGCQISPPPFVKTQESALDSAHQTVKIPEKWEAVQLLESFYDENSVDLATTWHTEQSVDSSGWLSTLNDDRLLDHIKTALINNPDLKASAANLQASIENAKSVGANLWPQLDAQLNRNRAQLENPDDASTSPIYRTTYTGSYNISWELDIWGKLSASKKAAVLDTEAQQANHVAAELALVANIARAWFNLNALKQRLDIANQRWQSQQSTLTVIEDNYTSGLNSALEVYLNRTDLAAQQAAIYDLEDSLDQAKRAFKQLLGEYPSTTLEFTGKLPELSAAIPVGLPSELLERRPDVLASLRQWQASRLNAKAAQRARLPSFSLTASYGASSEQLKLLDQQQLLWNLINNLSLPIFQGGRLAARAKQARYQQDASLQNYLSTLLTGFNEVENALGSEQALKKRFQSVKDAAYYSESGYKLALEQYQRGLINYTTLLESQRRWFDAQSDLINLKNALLQNRIALHLALGGDFAVANPTAPVVKTATSPTSNTNPPDSQVVK